MNGECKLDTDGSTYTAPGKLHRYILRNCTEIQKILLFIASPHPSVPHGEIIISIILLIPSPVREEDTAGFFFFYESEIMQGIRGIFLLIINASLLCFYETIQLIQILKSLLYYIVCSGRQTVVKCTLLITARTNDSLCIAS